MFEFLGRYIFYGMEWLYINVVNDVFLVICISTVLLKMVTLPADIIQKKSSNKTAAAQVELNKIKKRYESNPEIAQRKQMEYYKLNGINPYAGCLPMVVTLLLFMIFFRAMNAWANINTINILVEASKGNYEILTQNSWLWIHNIWQPDSGFASVVMDATAFANIPFDTMVPFFDQATLDWVRSIAANPDQYNQIMQPVLDIYKGLSNGWFIMPVLAGGSMILQQMIMNKSNPQMAQAPGMGKGMMYGMSAVSVWVCATTSASFAIYWLISNVVSLVTTLVLNAISKKKTAEQPGEAK